MHVFLVIVVKLMQPSPRLSLSLFAALRYLNKS